MTTEINPIIKYKDSNPDVTWKQMADVTGISIQGLIYLSKLDKKGRGNVKISTILSLKENLGIDYME